MMNLKKHIDLLGYKVEDKVTGFTGVLASVSFDLYGCVQAIVTPTGLDKDGKIMDAHWFDISRLKILGKVPVMTPPDYFFEEGESAEQSLKKAITKGAKGPAAKPPTSRY